MLKIAVVDDEIVFVENLVNKISEICKKLNLTVIIDRCSNGFDILENYKKYHLIFLDIEMPSIDGITVANKINESKKEKEVPYITFVTCKDNLVFQALKCHPYLFIRKSELGSDLDYCLSTVNNKLKTLSPKYTIHSGRNDFTIDIDSITYLEKDKNYVVYHTINQKYNVRNNMNDEFMKLEKYSFIRTHIGFAVNSKFIAKIQNNSILLTTNAEIPIGKKYRDNVKSRYFEWLGEEYV